VVLVRSSTLSTGVEEPGTGLTRPKPERSLMLNPVSFQPVRELYGVAECHEVPASHLVGCQAQTVTNDSTLELHREEAVIPALEEHCGDIWPGLQGPRLRERGLRLGWRSVGHGLGPEIDWDVVEESIEEIRVVIEQPAVVSGLPLSGCAMAGVFPPVSSCLTGHGDHGVEHHQEIHG
jgi:hypothetical protein